MTYDPRDRFSKALAGKAHTSASKPYWDEIFTRATLGAVEGELEGITGSWAGVWGMAPNVKGSNSPVGNPRTSVQGSPGFQFKESRLGVPGFPEINFRPYDARTARQSNWGPSLVGHPISFEFVGPTNKTKFNNWQWLVTDNSGTGNGDVLTLDTTDAFDSIFGAPTSPNWTDLADIYGISSIPESGLYLYVSQTGELGALDDIDGIGTAGDGGLGSGLIGDRLPVPVNVACSANSTYSQYELFKVTAISATTLTLDPSKRLADWFNIPSLMGGFQACIRSVCLITPKATRVVAIPGSGRKVYAIVPPEQTCTSDLMPPRRAWDDIVNRPTAPTIWDNYSAATETGTDYTNDDKQVSPIPTPIRHGVGRVQGTNGDPVFANYGLGQIGITVDDGSIVADDVTEGRLIYVYDVESFGGAILNQTGLVAELPLSSLQGWYGIVSFTQVPPARITLKRVLPFDPDTGVPLLVPGANYRVDSSASFAERIELRFTVHNPVSSLWNSNYARLEEILASRLHPILDPSKNKPVDGRSFYFTSSDPTFVSALSRADKCIFDTSGGNPGSLLDLGFRAVLFPAKNVAGSLIADFDNPLPNNNMVLDPAVTTEQYVDIDYTSGLVYLSHAPAVGGDLVPLANVLTATDNPRGEPTFFISCVPYSLEPSARTAGIKVSATNGSQYDSECFGPGEFASVFSGRKFWRLSNQTLTVSGGNVTTIDIEGATNTDLPETGYVEILRGIDPTGDPAFLDNNVDAHRVATFGYSKVTSGSPTTLEGVFGGGKSGDSITVTDGEPYVAVLRRNVWPFTNQGNGFVGTDFRSDLNYGSMDKATSLRFEGAELQKLGDGSVAVKIRDPRATAAEANFGDLFRSWLISGAVASDAGLDLTLTQSVFLVGGKRITMPPTVVTLGNNATQYVYLDTTDPCDCSFALSANSSPLSNESDILLYKAVTSGGVVTELVDLRNPLVDLDARLDVYVGRSDALESLGGQSPYFQTLAEAVAYVKEILDPDSGFDGNYIRIQVVGHTLETELPILPVSGMIIEGLAKVSDGGVAGSTHGIHWEDRSYPLFLLDGCSDLVFRNLNLIYDDDGQPANPTNNQLPFKAETGISFRLVFEDILFDGNDKAHGFIYCDPLAALGSCYITRCYTGGTTDYGLYFEGAVNCKVTDCRFSQGGTAQLAITTQAGVIDDGSSNLYRGIWSVGFEYGFVDEGTRNRWESCTSSGPGTGYGFLIGSAGTPNTVGIYSTVVSCQVLTGGLLNYGDYLSLQGFRCDDATAISGVHSTVSGCHFGGMVTLASSYNVLSDNQLLGSTNIVLGLGAFDVSLTLSSASSNIIRGNTSLGSFYFDASTRTNCAGNTFPGLGANDATILILAGSDDCIVSGNVAYAIYNLGNGCVFTGNWLDDYINLNATTGCVLTGNKAGGVINATSTNWVIVGNSAGGGVTAGGGGDPDGPAYTSLLVGNKVGNLGVFGGAPDDTGRENNIT